MQHSMWRYSLIFLVGYFVAAVLLEVVVELFKLRIGAGVGVGAILAASMFAAREFANEHRREPTLIEKRAYAWQALLGLWSVSLVAFGSIVAFFSGADERKLLSELFSTGWILMLIVAGVMLISLVSYVAIRWSFAWYARIVCKTFTDHEVSEGS